VKVSKNKLGKKGRQWKTEINAAFNFTALTVQRDDEGDSITADDEEDNFKRKLK
jgi:hypothetical protein